jgi:hypothetical protein
MCDISIKNLPFQRKVDLYKSTNLGEWSANRVLAVVTIKKRADSELDIESLVDFLKERMVSKENID